MSKLNFDYTEEQMELAKELNRECEALSSNMGTSDDDLAGLLQDIQVFNCIKLAGMELRLRKLEGRVDFSKLGCDA